MRDRWLRWWKARRSSIVRVTGTIVVILAMASWSWRRARDRDTLVEASQVLEQSAQARRKQATRRAFELQTESALRQAQVYLGRAIARAEAQDMLTMGVYAAAALAIHPGNARNSNFDPWLQQRKPKFTELVAQAHSLLHLARSAPLQGLENFVPVAPRAAAALSRRGDHYAFVRDGELFRGSMMSEDPAVSPRRRIDGITSLGFAATGDSIWILAQRGRSAWIWSPGAEDVQLVRRFETPQAMFALCGERGWASSDANGRVQLKSSERKTPENIVFSSVTTLLCAPDSRHVFLGERSGRGSLVSIRGGERERLDTHAPCPRCGCCVYTGLEANCDRGG